MTIKTSPESDLLSREDLEFIKQIINPFEDAETEKSGDFCNMLYGKVWRDNRYDLLELALCSLDPDIKGSAYFVLSEVAYKPQAHGMKSFILSAWREGKFSEKEALGFFVHTLQFDKEVSEFILEMITRHDLLKRHRSIEFMSRIKLDDLNFLGGIIMKDSSFDAQTYPFVASSFDNRSRRALYLSLMVRSGCSAEEISYNCKGEDMWVIENAIDLLTCRPEIDFDVHNPVFR